MIAQSIEWWVVQEVAIARADPNIEDNAASSGMKVVDCTVRDGPEIQAAIGAFDGEPTTGLIVLPDPIFGGDSLSLIFELATRQHHPAIYP